MNISGVRKSLPFYWVVLAVLAERISAFHTATLTSTRSSLISSGQLIFRSHATVTPPRRYLPSLCTSDTKYHDSGNATAAGATTDAQKLLDKVAKLRAEIAEAEGKTVEQVENEATVKKTEECLRKERAREGALAAEAARNSLGERNSSDRGETGAVQVPVAFDDMVRQAARAVERAFQDGKIRQTVRFNLVGEEEAATEENEWPGGAKQMYRESGGPLTDALLREIRAPTKNIDSVPETRRLNPALKAQDIWDFDGSALHTAEAAEGPSADIQALVFPNTDGKYLEDIEKTSNAMGSRLFLLVNPFWRNIESWGFNILAPGAKKRAQEVIFGENPFELSYSLMCFSVRGEKCVAIKAYPYDWQLFAFREDEYYQNEEYAIRLGSSKDDPNSSLITQLLNERPEFKETRTMRQIKKI